MIQIWKTWLSTLNWWEFHFFLPLGILVTMSVIGALTLSISHRANDIYMNKNTKYEELWAYLLWPVFIPYALVEYPAQFIVKIKEYKRKKKFSNVA